MSARNGGKRVLILWADDTSTNLGVRVLAEGSANLVRRAWPDAEIVFHTFGNSSPELPMGRLRTLVRERVTGKRGTLEWLAGFDLVVDTRAGDSFADIYGLRRLRIMSAIAELATQAGTPVVMAPQTIGPFNSRQGLAIGRHSMRRAAATMARDSVSADYAASVGRPVDLLTTDVVFALPTPVVAKKRDVLLNVSGLLWQESPHVDAAAYRAVVTDLYRALTAEGRSVGLLAHVLDSSNADNDVPALHEFQTLGRRRFGARHPGGSRRGTRGRGRGERGHRLPDARMPECPVGGNPGHSAGLFAKVPAAARRPRASPHRGPSHRRSRGRL